MGVTKNIIIIAEEAWPKKFPCWWARCGRTAAAAPNSRCPPTWAAAPVNATAAAPTPAAASGAIAALPPITAAAPPAPTIARRRTA